jgi:hypothetical protein
VSNTTYPPCLRVLPSHPHPNHHYTPLQPRSSVSQLLLIVVLGILTSCLHFPASISRFCTCSQNASVLGRNRMLLVIWNFLVDAHIFLFNHSLSGLTGRDNLLVFNGFYMFLPSILL